MLRGKNNDGNSILMHWHDKRLNKFNIGNIESLSGKNLINHFNPAPIIEKKDNQTLISPTIN
ncbi:hypothetical protein GCT62_08945 [Yersinia enterocolitica]|nr:hypothetical protein [Yersinia enterocolitica]